ncbi:protease SohB [Kineosporia sp. A_224]|uniref:protease SohB n=1 Tax=Kineosporia sp. A_224 TaxID=1962180 RepID=UPI0018EA09D7|nr:protease SohB [Kineosporia sp. A_224]
MSFLREYGLFLLETLTVVAAIVTVLVTVAVLVGRTARARRPDARGLRVRNLNRTFEDLGIALRSHTVPRKVAKAQARALRKQRKALDAKGPVTGAAEGPAGTAGTASGRPRVFVLDFHGDIRATEVAGLREEVTAVVSVARPGDEVVVRLENPGGTVHDQGFAAAQLLRVRSRGVRLVVAVDKVAASGGYMMACVADRIIAAPFAVVGSIGVITEIPNVFRLLERAGVEFEQVTGGEYKRTVTPFTQTTPAKREKLTEQVADIHALFKEWVATNRPQVDIERVATGEHWYGTRAVELGLVDELVTSDDYLLARAAEADLYSVRWTQGHRTARRLASLVSSLTSMTSADPLR